MLLLILISSCTVPQTHPSPPNNKKACFIDTDCVPASCCHAKDAVNKANAPSCAGSFCTMDCAPGTIDCGQGEIKCVQNECKAIIY